MFEKGDRVVSSVTGREYKVLWPCNNYYFACEDVKTPRIVRHFQQQHLTLVSENTPSSSNDKMRDLMERAMAELGDAPEISPGNYSDDEVLKLNNAANQAYNILDAALSIAEKENNDE